MQPIPFFPFHPLHLPALPGRLNALLAGIRETLRRWRAEDDARATAHALSHLDDRTLRDLGIDRSQVGAIGAELHGLAHPSMRRVIQVI